MNRAKEISIVPIKKIKPNPKNRNKHSDEQIERLKKLIEAHGFRAPLVVSNRSGMLVAGHGRLLAAKALGFKELPVVYQDFETDEEEYQVGIADNAIASWAELDLAGIHVDLPEMGPFDLDLLGIDGFALEPATESPPEPSEEKKKKECPVCGYQG